MEPLKTTPIDEIEDLADGVPVLAVDGTVKYSGDLKRGTSPKGVEWTKQFFVLGSDTAEIACSMWDAEGSEVAKGEKVRIENTKNKKGEWKGMIKGSYQKDGERKHTLEIRATQVKISAPNGGEKNTTPKYHDRITPEGHADEMPPQTDPDWPEAPPVLSGETRYPGTCGVKPKSILDERQRAIIRQHSQTAAIEILKLKQELGELAVNDLTPSKIKALANFFDQDVFDAITNA